MNNIDILEELIKDYKDEKEFVGEEIIKAIETLITENKELKEEKEILKQKIITIRNYVKPYTIWYDLGTKNYNLKGCTKQEIYKIFSKIRSEVKGEYIFLENDKYLQSLLEKE